MSRSVMHVCLCLLLLFAADAQAQSLRRSVPEAADAMDLQTTAPTGRIVVKFPPGNDRLVQIRIK